MYPRNTKVNPQEIIQRLKDGNERYVQDQLEGKNQDIERRNALIASQQPFAIVLSCADSRVVPEMIFDTGLGELFVVRVAGNVANTSSLASIEYAVAHCGSRVIVVLGHENCGAVSAAVNGGDNGYNLNHLLAHINPALEEAGEAEVNEVVKVNAQLNARELSSRSSIISNTSEKRWVKNYSGLL